MKIILQTSWTSVSIDAAGDSHPNILPFKGVLLILDEPSTQPPNGSKGHRILIPTDVAEKRLNTLIGMGVNLSENKEGHDPQRKVGVIDKAWIKGKELWVKGKLWKKQMSHFLVWL